MVKLGLTRLFESRLFVHATKPQILARMLANLKRLYVRMHSFPQARDITDLLVAVNPSAIDETCSYPICCSVSAASAERFPRAQ